MIRTVLRFQVLELGMSLDVYLVYLDIRCMRFFLSRMYDAVTAARLSSAHSRLVTESRQLAAPTPLHSARLGHSSL